MQLVGAAPGCLPIAAAGVFPVQEQYRTLWDRPAFDGKDPARQVSAQGDSPSTAEEAGLPVQCPLWRPLNGSERELVTFSLAGAPNADSLLVVELARSIRMARRFASYCADAHVGGAA
jgi:hypothetical protein